VRLAISLSFLFLAFAGCLVEPAHTPEVDTPVVLPDVLTDMQYVTNGNNQSTDGLWLHNDFAYLSGPSGLRIVDISNPEFPVMVSNDIEDTGSRDVDIMVHPDGRLYAVLASGGAGTRLVDVTDPTTASVVSQVSVGSHNIAVVPNSTIVYNSRSISAHVPGAGESGQVDLIDFADPAVPVVKVFAFPAVIIDPNGAPRQVSSTTCHDMTFNVQRQLAYCAGVTDTTIWDIADPWNPVIIQVIDWPGTNIHHGVWSAHGGDWLVLGDEIAGVAVQAPACSSTVPYPTSALWFFDITNLATPTPLGYYQIPYDAVQVNEGQVSYPYCSTHFGQIIEDRDQLVMGWYSAGSVLVDFSDPGNAQTIAHYRPDGAVNTWEARYYDGYIYTGDTARGMDILKLV